MLFEPLAGTLLSLGERGRFLPGVIVDLVGYSVGNHMGLTVFFLVRGAGLGL